ncbi:hypothetical protein L1987_58058 [Smallanthus sonchifolius]|uniref:Uncharacterized protein n=1 Tax=Smallanthus sonchifolius TaxID=185202 RepID=A0ACB9DEA3_9ASTR|nr:hypothetical protein L1987_58058 [Smallanthus sonchifolius]
MDWLGQSEYDRQLSFLSTTISEVIFAKYAKVKILVAYWAHYMSNTDQYLKSLLYSNNLCSSSPDNNCSGKIEIKSNTIWFFVSGNVSMTTWSNCLSMSKWVIWDFQLCSSTVDCQKYVYDESRRKILDNEYIKHFAPESSLKIPTGQIFCF